MLVQAENAALWQQMNIKDSSFVSAITSRKSPNGIAWLIPFFASVLAPHPVPESCCCKQTPGDRRVAHKAEAEMGAATHPCFMVAQHRGFTLGSCSPEPIGGCPDPFLGWGGEQSAQRCFDRTVGHLRDSPVEQRKISKRMKWRSFTDPSTSVVCPYRPASAWHQGEFCAAPVLSGLESIAVCPHGHAPWRRLRFPAAVNHPDSTLF